jgi:L-lactate dehydrogenase complex protein LldG
MVAESVHPRIQSRLDARHEGAAVSIAKGSRARVLDGIRSATASVASDSAVLAQLHAAIPREYIRQGTLSESAKIALLVERLRDYDANIIECNMDELHDTICAALTTSGRRTFGAPPSLKAAWMPSDFDWTIDAGLSHEQIEKLDGVVTGASCAIADSGTIVLHHTSTEGRRVLTLLPDWHLCILHVNDVVETFPEYFARVQHPPPLVTWISGPSATADIEMTRIKGVHGPRHLNVILVHP